MSAGPRPSTRPLPVAELVPLLGAHGRSNDPSPDAASATVVTGVTHDSRAVLPGDLYAALPGFRTHGAEFVREAAAAGASAVLTDPAGLDRALAAGVPVLVSDDPRAALGAIASRVYGDPSQDLLVVGITGTNGKTTTSYLVDAGLRADGRTTGVIGTVGTLIGDEPVATARTTPEATDVHALLAVMRERGVTAVTMEVSSHALRLGRVDGVRFDVVAFTNLSPDHLDFHRDMDDYFDAKAELFRADRAGRAVVCVDDEWGRRMAELAGARGLEVTTYALGGTAATWTARGVVGVPGGTVMRAHGRLSGGGFADVPLEVRLPGAFNAANALGALAVLEACGVDADVAADGIAACPGVPGRMERVPDPDASRGLFAYVDYAHTPDAVERALVAAREVLEARGAGGRVLVVLGAGGDRDPHKRRAMGEAAARGAEVVVVTDDNPRSEPPEAIRAELLRGAAVHPGTRTSEIGDRRDAVAAAVSAAQPGDVVLVLGKGHEQGQEAGGVVTPFDDRVVLAEALEAVHPGPGAAAGTAVRP
ncbi:MAG: UDP-N-acetylmuramoyl-L-alanyl-D-glutamate--2,6-diaminopimelate ligase [Frankiales bacterium]|nr:UDP-N-acetylmuramoyl-L-alanyl-D-glutamate--2,6-diaminopimelate ligase [Frankiales bacterium]